MEKKKIEWTDVLVILLFLGGGIWLIKSSFNVDDKDSVRPLKLLAESGIETLAALEDSVRVEERQGSSDTSRRYFNTYHFTVNGKSYSGEVETGSMPEARIVRIKYLPDDPAVNSAFAEQELQDARSDAQYGWRFWLGAFLCLCGFTAAKDALFPAKEKPKEKVEL